MFLGKPLLATLQRMNCGGVILDAYGQVLHLNSAAGRLLSNGACLDQGSCCSQEARTALKALLRAGEKRFTLDRETWAVVSREDRRQLVVHAVPIGEENQSGPHTVVILIDLGEAPQPSPVALQNIFGLTPAEAALAALVAKGEPLADIAKAHGTSISTARTQLASIFAKTHTNRQAELVALLARVAMLP